MNHSLRVIDMADLDARTVEAAANVDALAKSEWSVCLDLLRDLRNRIVHAHEASPEFIAQAARVIADLDLRNEFGEPTPLYTYVGAIRLLLGEEVRIGRQSVGRSRLWLTSCVRSSILSWKRKRTRMI